MLLTVAVWINMRVCHWTLFTKKKKESKPVVCASLSHIGVWITNLKWYGACGYMSSVNSSTRSILLEARVHNPEATSQKPNWTHKLSRNPYEVVSIGVSERLQWQSAMTNTPAQVQSRDWWILNPLFIAKPFTGASGSINNSEDWSLFLSLCVSVYTRDDCNHQKKTQKTTQPTPLWNWSTAVGKQHASRLCVLLFHAE